MKKSHLLLAVLVLSCLGGSPNTVYSQEESLTVAPDGNVGIGTSTPTAELEVVGTIKAERVDIHEEPVYAVKTGTVLMWLTETAPDGYLECNGQIVTEEEFPQLYEVIGTMYGNGDGDGTSTFNVPDLRGEFVRGWDGEANRDPGAAGRTDRGDGTGGNHVGTKQGNALQQHRHSANPPKTYTNTSGAHTHSISGGVTTGGSSLGRGGSRGDKAGQANPAGNHNHYVDIPNFNTGYAGGSETRPRNIAVMFIIKT